MLKKIPQTKIVGTLIENKKPIKILQGGTSSGKTYSILYRILIGCMFEWENETIDVIRDTMPALRISAMKDWEDILKKHGLYNKGMHNRSHNEYTIGSNLVRFYSADNEEKMRGPRRDRAYFNEVLEMRRMDVEQVVMRTKKETWMDYNPSETFHWVYDDYVDDEDNFFHKSTYKDNPFLEAEVIRRILKLKQRDPNMWRIYGLGERGVPQSTIYTNWHYAVNRLGREVSFEQFEGQRLFGMDFGFNDPTTLVRVKFHEKGGIYGEELLYKSGLTSDQIIQELDKLREDGKITYDDEIRADSARPEIIEDIKRAGYNIRKAKKEKGSILRGINFIKRYMLFIPKESVNMTKEIRAYKWRTDRNERVLDTPVDLNDHCLFEGTLITTNKGQKPIEEINVGDLVLTRKGFKKVTNAWCSSNNAELYEAEFSDGRTLIGTSEHKIFTKEKGFIRLDALSNICKVLDALSYVWELNLTGKNITKEKTNTGEELEEDIIYTEMFGNFITEKYLNVIKSITKTKINQIIQSKILNAYQLKNTQKNIYGPKKEKKKIENISKKLIRSRKNGINQKKEKNGTQNMEKIHGKIENQLSKNALYVLQNMKILQEERIQNIVPTNANQKDIELKNLKKLSCTGRVYDLTIEGEHEFFANGILVHNCMDALRYAVEKLSRNKKEIGVA